MGNVNVTREGRRSYLTGSTYDIKDAIKSAGGHWDPDRRAWWIGDDDKARTLAAKAAAAPPDTSPFAFGYAKLVDGSWGIRGKNLTPGTSVKVKTRAGDVKSETVAAVLSTAPDGTQTASITKSARSSSYGSGSGRRGYGGSGGSGRYGDSYGSGGGCGYPCPVTGRRCTADDPCHDCQ